MCTCACAHYLICRQIKIHTNSCIVNYIVFFFHDTGTIPYRIISNVNSMDKIVYRFIFRGKKAVWFTSAAPVNFENSNLFRNLIVHSKLSSIHPLPFVWTYFQMITRKLQSDNLFNVCCVIVCICQSSYVSNRYTVRWL